MLIRIQIILYTIENVEKLNGWLHLWSFRSKDISSHQIKWSFLNYFEFLSIWILKEIVGYISVEFDGSKGEGREWSYLGGEAIWYFFFNRTLNITNCQHALETLWKVSITAPNYISASSFVSDENILVKLSKPKTNSFYLIFRGIILIQILISNRYFEIINIEYMHYFKRF